MSDEPEFPQGWRPNAGDTVKGVVSDLSIGQGGFDPYPIVTLKQENGVEVAVHAFHTVLQSELGRRKPKIGDELDITYLGKRQGANSKGSYDLYRVKGGQEEEFNWGKFTGEPEPDVHPVSDITPADAIVGQPVTVPDDDPTDLPFLWDGAPSYEERRGHASRW